MSTTPPPPIDHPPLHVVVDGRNVMRSRWPNVDERDLVAAAARWARERPAPVQVAVVFDGRYDGWGPGVREHDERVVVVATRGEIADDVIVRETEQLRADGCDVLVATSDRELRERLTALGARLTGGGSFLRELLER